MEHDRQQRTSPEDMAPILDWETLDWEALGRLRERFLLGQEKAGTGVYWSSPKDLASYDFTFARRIGWKWGAVLAELRRRGWTLPAGPVLDWGCGSGVAGRTVLHFLAPAPPFPLLLWDHSPLATAYAAAAARREFPGLCATALPDLDATSSQRLGTVVVSHVLNELDKPGGEALRRALDKADSILWVEPGTFTDSRALIAVRESLREHFDVVAPCTHAAACGLLRPENARHWCHHFADPPTGLMADSNWVRFAKVSGIDLRSLPYSYLILERRGLRSPIPGGPSPAWSRVLGRPRVYKGFARLLSCQPEGVEELELQKRVDTALFKTLKNETAGSLWKWTREEASITAAEPIRVVPRLTSGGRGRSA